MEIDFRSSLIAASAKGVEHHGQLIEVVRHGFLPKKPSGQFLLFLDEFILVFLSSKMVKYGIFPESCVHVVFQDLNQT